MGLDVTDRSFSTYCQAQILLMCAFYVLHKLQNDILFAFGVKCLQVLIFEWQR